MSALSSFQDTVVGRPGLWQMVKYEIVTSLLGPLPGATGLLLRSIFYRLLLGHQGKGVFLGRSISFRGPHRVRLERGVILDEYCDISCRGEGSSVRIGPGSLIARGTSIHARNGSIEIGEDARIGMHCRIATTSRITIGRYALFAASCDIGGEEHGTSLDLPMSQQPLISKGGIEIGEDAWLGVGVTVLDGVTIGKGCIVGARSLVRKDLPDFAVAAGIPARILRFRHNPDDRPPAARLTNTGTPER